MTDYRYTNTAAIPVPPATARRGWTLYRAGQVVGWVRRAADDEVRERRPEGTFWVIPRIGPGDPAAYVNVRHAAQSPFLTSAP